MATEKIAQKHGPGNPRNDLDVEYVRSILDYDPETGVLRWRWRESVARCANARDADKIAGSIKSNGYRSIMIDGRSYRAHRLAWLIITGSWPAAEIDHINLVKDDNRLINLREASHGENNCNRRAPTNTTSGVKNVHWNKRARKWHGQVKNNGKLHHVGYFATIEEAVAPVALKRAEMHGKFGRAS